MSHTSQTKSHGNLKINYKKKYKWEKKFRNKREEEEPKETIRPSLNYL